MINKILSVKLLIKVMSIKTLQSKYNKIITSIGNYLNHLFFPKKVNILVCLQDDVKKQ